MAGQAVAVILLLRGSGAGRLRAMRMAGMVVAAVVMAGVIVIMLVSMIRAAGVAVLVLAVIMGMVVMAMRLSAVVMVVAAAAGILLGRGALGGRAGQSRRGIAETVDALLDRFRRGRAGIERERQRLRHHRELDVADAGQAFDGSANLRRAARAIHAADLPGQGLRGGFGAGGHDVSPSLFRYGTSLYKL